MKKIIAVVLIALASLSTLAFPARQHRAVRAQAVVEKCGCECHAKKHKRSFKKAEARRGRKTFKKAERRNGRKAFKKANARPNRGFNRVPPRRRAFMKARWFENR